MTCRKIEFTVRMERGYPLSIAMTLTDEVEGPVDTTAFTSVGVEIRKKTANDVIAGVLVKKYNSVSDPTVVIPKVDGLDIELNSAESLTFPDEVAKFDIELYALNGTEYQSLGFGEFSLCRAAARPWE
jgi:hypothetical protein